MAAQSSNITIITKFNIIDGIATHVGINTDSNTDSKHKNNTANTILVAILIANTAFILIKSVLLSVFLAILQWNIVSIAIFLETLLYC